MLSVNQSGAHGRRWSQQDPLFRSFISYCKEESARVAGAVYAEKALPLCFCAASLPKDEKKKDHPLRYKIALSIWHWVGFQIPEQKKRGGGYQEQKIKTGFQFCLKWKVRLLIYEVEKEWFNVNGQTMIQILDQILLPDTIFKWNLHCDKLIQNLLNRNLMYTK